jgi:hypothetical protein
MRVDSSQQQLILIHRDVHLRVFRFVRNRHPLNKVVSVRIVSPLPTSLIRIDGLERATTLRQLVVRRPMNAFQVSNLTHSRSFRSAQRQLLRRRACMCAPADTTRLSQRESHSPHVVADPFAALL